MLETTQLNPMIAEMDIPCYKVLRVKNKKGESFNCGQGGYSRVMDYWYNWDFEQPDIDIKNDGKVYTDVDGSKFVIVNEGYHSYTTKDEISFDPETEKIVVCVIPAGAKYFIGNSGRQYVSSTLIALSETSNHKCNIPEYQKIWKEQCLPKLLNILGLR
jgi:hypothetical protein